VESYEPVQGRFTTAAGRELARQKLDLVGVQEVRWNTGHSKSREL